MKSTYLGGAFGVGAVLLVAACDPAPVGSPEPAPKASPVNPSDAAMNKLDRILDKLDDLDRRIGAIERNLSQPGEPSLAPPFDLEFVAGFVNLLAELPVFNLYNPDPKMRIRELSNTSDDLRQIESEFDRLFGGYPSHLTPERVDGAIQ